MADEHDDWMKGLGVDIGALKNAASSGASNGGQPSQSVDPNAGQPDQSVDPNAGQPNQSVDPDAGQPNQSVDPNAGQLDQSVDPNVGQPDQSVDPNAGQPNQSVDPDAGQADQPIDPNAVNVVANTVATSSKTRPGFDGVTTYKATSKQALTKAGYRFARKDGAFDVWVKVDKSSFIWVQGPQPAEPGPSGSGSGPNPPPPPPPQPPLNPSIQDARDWANNLEKRFNELLEDAKKLQALKSPQGTYPRDPFNDYVNKLDRYDEDLKSVLNDEAPSWRDSLVTDEEKKALEKEIERIKNVKEHEPEMDL